MFFFLVNKQEIESLITIFKTLTKNYDRMDRFKFRDILQNSFNMTDDLMMDKGVTLKMIVYVSISFIINLSL